MWMDSSDPEKNLKQAKIQFWVLLILAVWIAGACWLFHPFLGVILGLLLTAVGFMNLQSARKIAALKLNSEQILQLRKQSQILLGLLLGTALVQRLLQLFRRSDSVTWFLLGGFIFAVVLYAVRTWRFFRKAKETPDENSRM